MKYNYSLVPFLLGVSITLVQPQIALALTKAEVNRIAKEFTVLITSPKNPGSGVIIKRNGNNYTVLTTAHVVKTKDKYEIFTPNGNRYPINYNTVKIIPGVDLAILQFTSSQNYTVAQIDNSDLATEGTAAYVAGFPKATAAKSRSLYTFTSGEINANASQPLRDGYSLVYSNNTSPGMSGGPVLNEQGKVIGIHGRADTDNNGLKTNFSLAIPINTFSRLSAKVGVNLGIRVPDAPKVTAPQASNFFLQAVDKQNRRDLQGAILAYTEAIRLNPNFVEAYNNRGMSRSDLGDKQGAIADFNQALQISPNSVEPYVNRGVARYSLGDTQGAIADFNQALQINPNNAQPYYNRGIARYSLGDKQGSISDFNQALRINPNLTEAYYNRGIVNFDLGDKKAAIEDYNQTLLMNPNLDAAYNNRGYVRYTLGDTQGAIIDFNQALRINPNNVQTYINRGIARYSLGDAQGAIVDINQGLVISPNNGQLYYNRGIARYSLGDKQGARTDFQTAAQLFQQQGNTQLYQQVLEHINRL
jgi:tetratricopeptide (TPR) repeat protein